MTDNTTQEPIVQEDQGAMQLPIILTLREIQGVLTALRKFPMEQVETLVNNIQGQANNVLAQIASTQQTGETK
jgi:hypothetical protein